MCYSVYLSTNCPDDLSLRPGELYHLCPVSDVDDPDIVGLLAHPARWFVEGQYGGCSCHFRHLAEGNDLGFGPPVDWLPEDRDEVEATKAVYDLLESLVVARYEVDLVDVWSGARPDAIRSLDVSLGALTRDEFRFFENRRFILSG